MLNNTDIWNYIEREKKKFQCKIKTASRWQQVTVIVWIIETILMSNGVKVKVDKNSNKLQILTKNSQVL